MKRPARVGSTLWFALFTGGAFASHAQGDGSRDSAGVRIAESAVSSWAPGKAWRLSATPTLEIGTVDGDTAHQLHLVSAAVRLSDGRVVIAQRDHVRIFSSRGRFISQIARAGQGPGELAGPVLQLMRFPGDTVGLWNGRRLQLFDAAGLFTRAIDYPVRDVLPGRVAEGATSLLLPDGSGLFRVPGRTPAQALAGPGTYRREEGLVRYVPGALRVDTAGFFPGREDVVMADGQYSIPPIRHQTIAAADADRLYIGDNAEFDIRVFELPTATGLTPSGKPPRLVAIARPSLSRTPVTSAERQSFAARERQAPPGVSPAEAQSRRQWAERYIAAVEWPVSHPAFTRLRADAQGNLWVVRHVNARGESVVAVLDRRGSYLGELLLPPRLSPLDIGHDYLVGLWSNDDGVNFVRVYTLQKPKE